MGRRLLAVLLPLLLLLGGCGGEQEAAEGRGFRYHLPARRPQGPVALVVMLHGGFGSARQAQRTYGWDALADAEGFAVVYPDGVGRAWNVGGGCCGRDGVDDVAYVEAVVARMGAIAPHGVDPRRVYATGMSNGGMMAYRLACDSDLFAAVGPVAATRLGDCAKPRPVSVLHVHGTADPRVRLDGEPGEGVAGIDGPPVAEVLDGWRAVDGCPAPVTTVDGPRTRVVAECPGGRAVELETVDGGGHEWFGATAELWAFFRQHPAAGPS